MVWATQAAAPAWLRATGLDTDDAGFVTVDAELRATGRPDVFAAGDAAAIDANVAAPYAGTYLKGRKAWAVRPGHRRPGQLAYLPR